jgi:hypothetical protein
MRIVSILYKFVYCVSLAAILAVLLKGVPFESVTTKPKALLLWVYVIVLLLTGVVAAVSQRLSRTVVWGVVAALCVLFTWQGWFGPGGFFVQTEGHTFDPVAAAAESAHFNRQAALSYAVMLVWFLTLPILRHVSGRIRRSDPGRGIAPAH